MMIKTDAPSVRAYTILAALVCCSALVLQLGLSLGLTIGDGRGVMSGLVAYFGYFTILTNLLAALALSAPIFARNLALGRFFSRASVTTGVATAMAVVGITYSLLLRNTWNPQGWQRVADIILHDAMPLLFLIYWWLAVPRGALHWREIPGWCVYPIAYFAYALMRGALIGSYPYAFIDAGVLGYMHTFVNAVGLLCGYAMVAAALVLLKRNPTPSATRSI